MSSSKRTAVGRISPFSLLDRAALAITQILLRNRTIEERKQKMEDEFVRNLLNGEILNRMIFKPICLQQAEICISEFLSYR